MSELFRSNTNDVLGFLAAALFMAGLYTVLLPAASTQEVSLANWHYLDPELLFFSGAYGVLFAAAIMLQWRSMRRVQDRSGRSLGVAAFVGSLLPNMFCCTPIVPTLLALLGFSTVGIYGISGGVQSFFANEEIFFLVGGMILLLISIVWSLRVLRRSACALPSGKGGGL